MSIPSRTKIFKKGLIQFYMRATFTHYFQVILSEKKMHIITVNTKDRTFSKYLGDGFKNTRMVLREWFPT